MTENLHVISSKATILEALSSLNALSGGVMTLLVTDDNGKLQGTLTDGDIRRALLRGESVNEHVTTAMNRNFCALQGDDIDVAQVREYRRKGITLLPHLNSDGTIRCIHNLKKTNTILPLDAILMAGGKGERLRPLTLTTPKPLLEISGKPIIDYNIEALAAVGIKNVTVATRYLAEKIYAHFEKPVAGISVKCITEDKPMGTIGAASLVNLKKDGNTLVMNSDLLTSVSFEDMYIKHTSENADITVAAIPYTVSVPFAILTTEGSSITGLEEKPIYSYYANAGIYIISNNLLRQLPKNSPTDATTLIEDAIRDNYKVVYYPITGTWIDIGTPADFAHAQELMQHLKNLSL